ncbi:MAG: response regulator [Chlorobiaceae bacterium]|nr:response regulator [Chlorobiaceae bacterium]
MAAGYTSKASLLKKFKEFLRKDYERNEFTIGIARYVGFWCHPLYYLIWTAILPQPYESFWLRYSSCILFTPFFFFKRYPVSFRPWLNLYWYFWLTLTLPVIFTYLMLMNNFSGMWLICETMSILVFIIFIPNYYMLTVLLVGGIAAAYGGFVAATGKQVILSTEIITYILPMPMAMLLGLLSGFTIKKGEIAQERNRVLQSLAGTIAHEMRNPLGQIRNCLNGIHTLLPKRHQESSNHPFNTPILENLYERVAHGQMAVKRGVQIIDMVLGEIREKPISQESFTYLSASRILLNALDEYSYETENEKNRVKITKDDRFIFRINETLFVFVLFNLLKNAIYYFKSFPQSDVTIRMEKGEGNNYIFFRDTGPGIPKDALQNVFESYYTSGKSGGTGLGLAYCKRVMKAFGGDIQCESEEGKFTEFIMSFPVVSQKELDEYTARVVAMGIADFRGKRLLIVDDDPIYRITLKKYLESLEAETDEAANGLEALELLGGFRYDMVIMDLSMPMMNGYETVERIRNGEAGPEAAMTPVVAHSSEPAAIARSMAENAGMQAFISKPCSRTELINTLRAALHTIPAGHPAKSALGGLKVLVVDDSALNCDLIAMNLKDAGLDVSVAYDGNESLELLHRQPFDLLITDIRMPGMDGLELVRKLRASSDAKLRSLPVIGMSGAIEEEEAAKHAGMNDFRIKTDSPGLLLNSICRLLAVKTEHPASEKYDKKKQAVADTISTYGFTASESAEFIRMFLEEFSDMPGRMRNSLKNNDIATLRSLSHKLKGSAALIGLETIRQVAEELEIECRAERKENLEKMVKTVSQELSGLSATMGKDPENSTI